MHEDAEELTYDPERAPEPDRWLSTGEWDRIAAIGLWHERSGIKPPNPHLHAVLHCIVENQVVLDEPPEVAAAVARLRSEGLSRHEAIHAVSTVLATHLQAMLQGDRSVPREYAAALRSLSREGAPGR